MSCWLTGGKHKLTNHGHILTLLQMWSLQTSSWTSLEAIPKSTIYIYIVPIFQKEVRTPISFGMSHFRRVNSIPPFPSVGWISKHQAQTCYLPGKLTREQAKNSLQKEGPSFQLYQIDWSVFFLMVPIFPTRKVKKLIPKKGVVHIEQPSPPLQTHIRRSAGVMKKWPIQTTHVFFGV